MFPVPVSDEKALRALVQHKRVRDIEWLGSGAPKIPQEVSARVKSHHSGVAVPGTNQGNIQSTLGNIPTAKGQRFSAFLLPLAPTK
jgi:hypothetical protein